MCAYFDPNVMCIHSVQYNKYHHYNVTKSNTPKVGIMILSNIIIPKFHSQMDLCWYEGTGLLGREPYKIIALYMLSQ